VFARVGGFDQAYPAAAGEDRDLCQRFHEAGVRMAYEHAAVVRHAHPLSFGGFWRQHLGYGRGAALFHRSRARRTGERVHIEPPGFYRLLLRGDPRVGGRIAVAQVANALGAALQWRRRTR
jgi:GT2 family glycosyltransferase